VSNKTTVTNIPTGFTQIPTALIRSDTMTPLDKLVYITIKSYADNKTHDAFPSYRTISKSSGLSRRAAIDAVKRLSQKGLLTVTQRRSSNSDGLTSNLYHVNDIDPDIWLSQGGANKDNEDLDSEEKEFIDSLPEEVLIDALRRRGFEVPARKIPTNEKEPASITDQSLGADPYNLPMTDNSTKTSSSQAEKYPMDILKKMFEYEHLLLKYPFDRSKIDTILDIVYETVNFATAEYIKIKGEQKPLAVVVAKFVKLSYDDIEAVIRTYNEQRATVTIKNTRGYLTSLLYYAKEQNTLDIEDQVNLDMSNNF